MQLTTMCYFSQVDYIEIPIGFAIAMGSIMSQRLLLNLRERYSDMHPDTSISTESTRYAIPLHLTSTVDNFESGIMLSTFNNRARNV